jgi:hypothetical protein
MLNLARQALVHWLLDYGVEVNGICEGESTHEGHAIIRAAGMAHAHVVDLLLERAADPMQGRGSRRGKVWLAAAAAGSLSILRKLIEHALSFAEDPAIDSRSLSYSLSMEQTDMFDVSLDVRLATQQRYVNLLRIATVQTGVSDVVGEMQS